MADKFDNSGQGGLDSPARHAAAVTPHDSTNLGFTTRALYVNTAGTISVEMAGGESAVSFVVTAGSTVPIRVTRVNSTGTTDAVVVALW